MARFILKRIGYMLITLCVVITLTFFMVHSIPGDPLSYMAKNLPAQTRANYYAKYGLDKPVGQQYLIFMKRLITKGDLGESIRYPGRSVSHTIAHNSKISGLNGGVALGLGLVIGVLLGIVAALNKNKWPDYVVMFIAILGITIPVFVLAAIFQYVFTVMWQILPTTGWGAPKYMVLPVITLSFGTIATYARYVKSSMLDVMSQDYILTAEAKGLSRVGIIQHHVLRNAFLPCITILGGQIAGIFTGSFIVEKIFCIPGLGYYYVSAISDRDYTMVLGTTIFYAALFVICQLLIDILYGVLDPRMKVKD